MRAELANLSHCAVLFLSRTAVNLSWYESTCNDIYIRYKNHFQRVLLKSLQVYSIHNTYRMPQNENVVQCCQYNLLRVNGIHVFLVFNNKEKEGNR